MSRITPEKPATLIRPKPPTGYRTWLDYVVDSIETRDAYHDQFFLTRPGSRLFERSEMQAAMLAELDQLRTAANVEDTFPKRRRRFIESEAQSTAKA